MPPSPTLPLRNTFRASRFRRRVFQLLDLILPPDFMQVIQPEFYSNSWVRSPPRATIARLPPAQPSIEFTDGENKVALKTGWFGGHERFSALFTLPVPAVRLPDCSCPESGGITSRYCIRRQGPESKRRDAVPSNRSARIGETAAMRRIERLSICRWMEGPRTEGRSYRSPGRWRSG